jgi:aspartate racemase
MKHDPCIGLIGGLGVGATVYYYQTLARISRARSQMLNLTMVHAEFDRIHELIDAHNGRGMAAYLGLFIKRLKAAGAGMVVIPAVTPHFCLEELRKISELPLIDIFESLNAELAERKSDARACLEPDS